MRLHFVQAMYMAESRSQFLATFLHDAMTDPGALGDKYADTLGLDAAGPAGACSNSTATPLVTLDTQSAIACSDGDDLTGRSYGYWREYVSRLTSVSPVGAGVSVTMRIPCSGWPSRSKWSFKGPFRTPRAHGVASPSVSDAPAAPLLFMSTRKDPVTPLKNARKMAGRHPEAGLVVQESTGHCVTLGPFGPCVKSIVSHYFDTGEVPSGEVSCEGTSGAWDEGADVAETVLANFAFPLRPV